MKIIFFLALIQTTIALSQGIPKKANTILVKGIVFDSVVNGLLNEGYKIDKIDKDYQTLRTEPFRFLKSSGDLISLDIRIKDSTAIITGFCALEAAAFRLRESSMMSGSVENRGMNKSLIREAFDEMNRFALSLHGQISYAKL